MSERREAVKPRPWRHGARARGRKSIASSGAELEACGTDAGACPFRCPTGQSAYQAALTRSLSDLHEETLVGETGDGDQGGDCARSPEAGPSGRHATSTRGGSAPAAGGGAARDANDSASRRD